MLLDYLAARFPYNTREKWRALIELGRLELDGRAAAADSPLREGQPLRFAVVDYDEPEVPLDFRVLARRGDLALVHKPAGMPVHRTGKIFFQTLANLLRERLGDEAWAPLNRLDRETGGLVAFARGPEAFRLYAPASPATRWTKAYLAVARGRLPAEEGVFDGPLAEQEGDPIRSRMHVTPGGKPALTWYRRLAERDGVTLAALSPVTGRKHQLRAHLAAAGCPLVGDKLYADDGRAYLKRVDTPLDEEDFTRLGARHHLLHAFHLSLEPEGGEAFENCDWEADGDFARYFDLAEARAWFDSEGRSLLRARVDALR